MDPAGNILPPESSNHNISNDSKVCSTAKTELPNFVGSAKDCTVPVTTEDVEMKGTPYFGVITTELISGNIGAGPVPALVVKGHKSTSMTFDITSTEWCNSSKVPGVEPAPIFGVDGTKGVTVKVEESKVAILGVATP